MSAAHNKKNGGDLFDKIILRTLLGILCTIGFFLMVIGRYYWRSRGDAQMVEALFGQWADFLTPVTVTVALVCVGVAAVLVVRELASLD